MPCTSLLDAAKINAGRAAFQAEKALGSFGDYTTHDSTTMVYLSAGGVNGDVSQILGVRVNKDTRKFWVSTQTGFPPTDGPSAKHSITYRGQVWAIQNTANPDGIGYRFQLDCILTMGMSLQK